MAHWGTRQSPSLCALWIPCRRPLLYRQKSRPSVIQDIPREIPKEILRPFSPRADQHETPLHLQPRGDGNHSYQIHQMIKLCLSIVIISSFPHQWDLTSMWLRERSDCIDAFFRFYIGAFIMSLSQPCLLFEGYLLLIRLASLLLSLLRIRMFPLNSFFRSPWFLCGCLIWVYYSNSLGLLAR